MKKLTCEQLSEKVFKKKIFRGEVFVIKNSKEIAKITQIIQMYFLYIFNVKIKNSGKKQLLLKDQNNLFFTILQNRVKRCKLIRNYFSKFLEKIGFNVQETYMDLITLRFSPSNGEDSLGTLNPVEAHRDTWASNLFHQINFWFPIHKVTDKNSIFLIPEYFNKEISNNSGIWNYAFYKQKKNYPSTPITNENFYKKEILSFSLIKGEVLCFSGHHLHGSNLGNFERFNLETRVVCKNDNKKYKIPKNLDSENKIKKKKWFKNLVSGKSYT